MLLLQKSGQNAAMFTGLSTILSTPDLPRSVAFSTAGLDAEVTYQFPTEGDPGYVALAVAGANLGIAADPASAAADGPQRHALWVYCSDADAAADRLGRGRRHAGQSADGHALG